MAIKKIIISFLTGFLLIANSAFHIPRSSDAEEYNIKAAFLYRFIEYVEWTNYTGREVFTIGILGESGITAPLTEITNNRRSRINRIVVRQYDALNDIGACQILFVPKNNTVPIETIISRIGNRQFLLITEQKDGCERGAHINFLISQNKLKFEVNLKTASRSGLKISSQLLQHASVIIN